MSEGGARVAALVASLVLLPLAVWAAGLLALTGLFASSCGGWSTDCDQVGGALAMAGALVVVATSATLLARWIPRVFGARVAWRTAAPAGGGVAVLGIVAAVVALGTT